MPSGVGGRRPEPPDYQAKLAKFIAAQRKLEALHEDVMRAMVLDFADVQPNPARDKKHVKMPREERRHVEPPTAEYVEAVVRLLPSR